MISGRQLAIVARILRLDYVAIVERLPSSDSAVMSRRGNYSPAYRVRDVHMVIRDMLT